MKDFLKDYGTLIGPVFAFILGVLAIYLKFYTDRQLAKWRSKRKMKKLIQLIFDCRPPIGALPVFHPGVKADLSNVIKNARNYSIFKKRLKVVTGYIDSSENDILTDGTVTNIQYFHEIKVKWSFLLKRINEKEELKFSIEDKSDSRENHFNNIIKSYEDLIIFCKNPKHVFEYYR